MHFSYLLNNYVLDIKIIMTLWLYITYILYIHAFYHLKMKKKMFKGHFKFHNFQGQKHIWIKSTKMYWKFECFKHTQGLLKYHEFWSKSFIRTLQLMEPSFEIDNPIIVPPLWFSKIQDYNFKQCVLLIVAPFILFAPMLSSSWILT